MEKETCIMTNLNKTREGIIYELLLSLNQGNSGDASMRVEVATTQYELLIGKGLIKEQKQGFAFSDEASFPEGKKFCDMDNTEIRGITYELCPLKCVSCEALCNEMAVLHCRHNLSKAYDN